MIAANTRTEAARTRGLRAEHTDEAQLRADARARGMLAMLFFVRVLYLSLNGEPQPARPAHRPAPQVELAAPKPTPEDEERRRADRIRALLIFTNAVSQPLGIAIGSQS